MTSIDRNGISQPLHQLLEDAHFPPHLEAFMDHALEETPNQSRVKSRSFCNFLQALSLFYRSMSVTSSVFCSPWRRCSSSSRISR